MSIKHILEDIIALPPDLHGCGSVSENVLRGIFKYGSKMDIQYSLETGSGKTTMLLTHLSKNHTVFALDIENSVEVVRSSTLVNKESYNWINGPTQKTVPQFNFDKKYQLVYLDGPHGYPFPELEYYFIYPHIATGGLLIIDDIIVPTIYNLYKFLKQDEMFVELEVIDATAFFRRTDAKTFDPYGDGWWLQGYNKKHYPIPVNFKIFLKGILPESIKSFLKKKLSK